jgi:hypothetical protein
VNTTEFIEKVKSDCIKNNVELIISPLNRVFYDHICCNGFFEPEFAIEATADHVLGKINETITYSGNTRPALAASQGGKNDTEFLSLLAHEYCHMLQYLENSKLWLSSEQFSIFDEWLSGVEVDKSLLESIWSGIILLEADCERRVVNLINELDLPLSITDYCRRANSYLFFYHWVKKHRKWYNKAPYEIDYILNAMPTRIFKDLTMYIDTAVVPESSLHLFDGCA